jgi:hypothetical protein
VPAPKVERKPSFIAMKRYKVSISQVVCADVEVEADTEEKARKEVTSSGIDHELYCEGHRDTRVINSGEEITDPEA